MIFVALVVVALSGLYQYTTNANRPQVPAVVETTVHSHDVEPALDFDGVAAMFLTPSGELWGWGENSSGVALHAQFNFRTLSPIPLSAASDWIDVGAWMRGGIGIKDTGMLWQWGLIHSQSTAENPKLVNHDTDWKSIDTGWNHVLAMKSDGSLWGWGYNGQGQLGDGTRADSFKPVRVKSENTWLDFQGGASLSLGIQSNGTLWAWGRLPGTMENLVEPAPMGSDKDWRAIHCAGYSAILEKNDGTLWVLGVSHARHSTEGKAPFPLNLGNDWKQIAGGFSGFRFYGIKKDGSLWMVLDRSKRKSKPIQIGDRTDWTHVWAGDQTYAGLTADGTLWTAGAMLGQERQFDLQSKLKMKALETLAEYGIKVNWTVEPRRKPPFERDSLWRIMKMNEP